ncbi:gustatory receptor for sugar taste 64a-like [Photinus pyralis]|uniref:gustatory receptor for sugar taste 64a-like n=1 Tax=Photinus pyralis TaxID=7054 RepID=UPI0012670CBC|nr:gustatory receptor for sugar taste 64a-like [Photinus pyralis]
MRDWHAMEMAMGSYGWPRRMNLRIKAMTVTILSIATIEHVLSVVGHFITADQLRTGDQDIFEYFFVVIAFPQVFAIISYSVWFGFLMQVITFASAFSWTYIDLFISVMGAGLAQRFQQVAVRVELYLDQKVSNQTLWKEVREDYVRLCILCRTLNERLSGLILLSFCSNLFYVLVQLFHSLNRIEGAVEKIYFFFSFGFLACRTVCVCLYGAWIGEESKRPLLSLNSVSPNIYSVEIRRFILHISFNPPSLSGKGFFVITRSLLLSIAGAIMTYELVLMQTFVASKMKN